MGMRWGRVVAREPGGHASPSHARISPSEDATYLIGSLKVARLLGPLNGSRGGPDAPCTNRRSVILEAAVVL